MDDLFASQQDHYDQIQLAVVLDKANKSEHVLVGTYDSIVKTLNGGEAHLLCDVQQPIGSLLLHYPDDPEGAWNTCALTQLLDVLDVEKARKRQVIRPEKEKSAITFLQEQFQSGAPIPVYTACQIWSGYRALVDQDYEAITVDAYRNRMAKLTLSFMVETKERYLRLHPTKTYMDPMLRVQKMEMLNRFESLPRTQIINGQNALFVGASITDYMLHYANELKRMRIRFKACSNCNEVFAYSHGKQEICSEACQKRQRQRSNQKHAEKVATIDYETDLNRIRTYWNNRIELATNSGQYQEDDLIQMRTAHKLFKQKARMMRKKMVAGELTKKEWSIWVQGEYSKIKIMTSPD